MAISRSIREHLEIISKGSIQQLPLRMTLIMMVILDLFVGGEMFRESMEDRHPVFFL